MKSFGVMLEFGLRRKAWCVGGLGGVLCDDDESLPIPTPTPTPNVAAAELRAMLHRAARPSVGLLRRSLATAATTTAARPPLLLLPPLPLRKPLPTASSSCGAARLARLAAASSPAEPPPPPPPPLRRRSSSSSSRPSPLPPPPATALPAREPPPPAEHTTSTASTASTGTSTTSSSTSSTASTASTTSTTSTTPTTPTTAAAATATTSTAHSAETLALLPLLRAQPLHYITIHIHRFPFLVTVGDVVTLPFRLKGVIPGQTLRLTHASVIGSRDYTLKGNPYISESLFVCRATVVEETREPMREKKKTKRRQRHIRTIKSKHPYTVIRIKELVIKSGDE